MKNHKKDYTNTFRDLSEGILEFSDSKGKAWLSNYQNRLAKEDTTKEDRKNLMINSNPKYILRNYLAQEVIEAAQEGDFSVLNKLLEVLKNPFSEKEEYKDYAKSPPEWGKKLEISCSS